MAAAGGAAELAAARRMVGMLEAARRMVGLLAAARRMVGLLAAARRSRSLEAAEGIRTWRFGFRFLVFEMKRKKCFFVFF